MIKNKIKKYYIPVFITAFLMFSFSFKSDFFEVAKQLEIYTTLFKELNIYYVNEINPAELTNKAIKNTLKDLDPYTNYYDEQEVEEAKIKKEGEYSGIGVSVFYDNRGIILNEIYKGYEADRKKLKAGDIITKIGNQSLKKMEIDQLSQMLKVGINTSLELEILRQNKKKTVTVITEKVDINPVPFYDFIDKETGYIILTRFNEKASSEVKKAFTDLKSRGMKKLVFDLRDNPGGSLGEAINISNFFLPKGSTIVSTKAKVKKWSNIYRASNNPIDLTIPLIVLVNNKSASASEIVAGALQDYDRAVIIGERSFGKGLVQRFRDLTYGTQLKLTISKYYTPSGRCIQELDYANRDKNGRVPKFSEGNANSFKTKNGRVVYDGGGITPDISVGFLKINDVTKQLLQSRAIFNFTTYYFYNNPIIDQAIDFTFTNKEFKFFLNYIRLIDTTFLSRQEYVFKEAFKSLENNKVVYTEYQKIKENLKQEKINEIEKNEDFLSERIKNKILTRYYYKQGVFENKLKKDLLVIESMKVLKNKGQYTKILKGS